MPDLLRFTRLDQPCTGQVGFALDHPYVEFVYTPLLGPTAVALLRRIGLLLSADRTDVEVDAVTLSNELGIRASHTEALGNRSPLMKSLTRLTRRRLAEQIGTRHYGIYQEVPALGPDDLHRVPESARAIHHRALARRPHPESAD